MVVPNVREALSRPEPRRWIGVALVVLAAVGYSLSVVSARLAYDGGTNPLTVLTVRAVLTSAVLFLVLLVTGPRPRPPKPRRDAGFLLGIGICLSALCYYSAIRHMPVSLAVLIFFTYPIVVGIIARFTENEPLTAVKVGSLAAAFVGVALTLKVSAGGIDWQGVALAAAASIGLAVTTVWSGRAMRQTSARIVIFHMITIAAVAYLAVSLVSGALVWPATNGGWLALAGASVSYLTAFVCFYAAIAMIGPMRVAMLNNTEPVFTILLAAFLLSELLTPVQLIGATLVVGAIFIMHWHDRRAAERPRIPE